MANELKKNVYHVDAVGTITCDTMKPLIRAVLIVPNATDSYIQIKESVSGTIILEVLIENTESRYISFEAMKEGGIEVTNPFEVTELTNVDRILLYGDFRKESNKA
jgi:hypothetical protein